MIEATLVEISVGALKRIGATCYTTRKESEVKEKAKMIRRYLLCTDGSSLSKSTEALQKMPSPADARKVAKRS